MRFAKISLLVVAALLLLTIAAPSASAFIIQGHSPIVILLTDPSGGQFGCKGVPTSTYCYYNSTTDEASTFVNTLTPKECGTSGCTFTSYLNTSDGSYWSSISIPDPTPGTWTVTYYGYKTTGSFTLVGLSCSEKNSDSGNSGHSEPGCNDPSLCNKDGQYAYLNLCDPDAKGTFFVFQGTLNGNNCPSGCNVQFTNSLDGSLALVTSPPPSSVPEFPTSLPLVVAVAFLLLVALRNHSSSQSGRILRK